MNREILIGNVLDKIKEIPDNSIDCVITSPPYWGLRDYGVKGQWGLEPDFRDYLEKLRQLMNELKRVLKNTGTAWINLGDTYAGGGGKANEQGFQREAGTVTESNPDYPGKSKFRTTMGKSRFGIPERFYINCIDDGWIARNHIPWVKPNCMPSSVKDRFTNKWESVFFFAKQQKYYFNLDNVREKTITEIPSRKQKHKIQSLFGEEITIDPQRKGRISNNEDLNNRNFKTYEKKIHEKYEDDPQSNVARLHKERPGNPNHQPKGRSNFETGQKITEHLQNKQDSVIDPNTGKPKQTYAGFNERWANKAQDQYTQRVLDARASGVSHDNPLGNPNGKNPGDVFDEEWERQKSQMYGDDDKTDRRSRVLAFMNTKEQINNPLGKNPGDVMVDRSKPYAVVERQGTVYYRDLPPLNEIIDYLQDWRRKKGVSIDWLEEQFGNYTPHHWFDRSYGSFPTREDWIKAKELLGFDDTFDKQMTTLYPKPAEKRNDPTGKNPGDVFVISTKPFAHAHFATFPLELPTTILKAACPDRVCKKCGKPSEEIWERTTLGDTTGIRKLKIEDQYEVGKNSAMRLTGGGHTYNAWKAENPDKLIGRTDCGCNAGWQSGIVLDPFFGSGTVGVAAEKLGLNWIGIELKKEYVSDIITKRLDKHKNERLESFVQ